MTNASNMNTARKQAIDGYFGRTEWHGYRANGCVGVICGEISYYFFFDASDNITRVIVD